MMSMCIYKDPLYHPVYQIAQRKEVIWNKLSSKEYPQVE